MKKSAFYVELDQHTLTFWLKKYTMKELLLDSTGTLTCIKIFFLVQAIFHRCLFRGFSMELCLFFMVFLTRITFSFFPSSWSLYYRIHISKCSQLSLHISDRTTFVFSFMIHWESLFFLLPNLVSEPQNSTPSFS